MSFYFRFHLNRMMLILYGILFLIYPPHVCNFIFRFRCGSGLPISIYFHEFTFIVDCLVDCLRCKITLFTFNQFLHRYRCHSCEQPDCRESPEGVHMCENAIQVSVVRR